MPRDRGRRRRIHARRAQALSRGGGAASKADAGAWAAGAFVNTARCWDHRRCSGRCARVRESACGGGDARAREVSVSGARCRATPVPPRRTASGPPLERTRTNRPGAGRPATSRRARIAIPRICWASATRPLSSGSRSPRAGPTPPWMRCCRSSGGRCRRRRLTALERRRTLDIISYMLKANGIPAGPTELPTGCVKAAADRGDE